MDYVLLALIFAVLTYLAYTSPILRTPSAMLAGAVLLLLIIGLTIKLPCDLKHNTTCYFKAVPHATL